MTDGGAPAGGGRIHPVYVVCESTDDTDNPDWLAALQVALLDVADHFARRQALDEAIRISILEFGDRLVVVTPLSSPSGWRPAEMTFRSSGRPEYRSMFAALRTRLDRDQIELAAAGLRALRPLVLLALRSGPVETDRWQPGLDTLLDRQRFPLLSTICPAGPAAEFASRVVHPPQVGRRYLVPMAGRFAGAMTAIIVATGQRLLDIGGGQRPHASAFPDQDDLGNAAEVSAPEPGGVAILPATDWLTAPTVPAEPAATEPGGLAVPDGFLFDAATETFVSSLGPQTTLLPRWYVERAVREFRLTTIPDHRED